MRSYTILAGTFRLPDETMLGVGDRIDLEDDVARMHADKLCSQCPMRRRPPPNPPPSPPQPDARN